MPRLTRRQPADSARAQRLGIPDAATHLDVDVERADDPGEEVGVGAAPEGRVEVDEVQPLGALLLPGEGRLERVAELAAGARDALDELDGPALDDVDGGQELQAWQLGCGVGHGRSSGWSVLGSGAHLVAPAATSAPDPDRAPVCPATRRAGDRVHCPAGRPSPIDQ